MKIGIIDGDLSYRKNHRFPNLACMKISGYHKNKGDDVTLIIHPDPQACTAFDHVYLSKVFTDTEVPGSLLLLDNLDYGGTGFFYDKAAQLPYEVEHSFPDYHLYDDWLATQPKGSWQESYTDCSIGYLTRGCFRKCGFCVNQNYDRVLVHSPLEEFLDTSRSKIFLLDDNFFGCPDWKRLLQELQASGKRFQFKQGLDIRLLNEEKAELLFDSKYYGDFTFAFDNIADSAAFEEKLQALSCFPVKNTHDEINLLCIYNTGTRAGTLEALAAMREYLEDDEVELRQLTDSVMEKLGKVSDDEFDPLDLFPDFDATDQGENSLLS